MAASIKPYSCILESMNHQSYSTTCKNVRMDGECACCWSQKGRSVWGVLSEDTRLTPRPPPMTGRLACSHRMSHKFELVMRWTESLKRPSNVCKAAWETEGALRSRCNTMGALKDDLNEISASWHLMSLSLSTAMARSLKRSLHVLSNSGPWNKGAPKREALQTSTCEKYRSKSSVTE